MNKVNEFFHTLHQRAASAGVFGPLSMTESRLTAKALGCESDAEYRVDVVADRVWVSIVTPDRWLSESIESDLMHTGDHIEELVAEELIEHDVPDAKVICEHFRSEDRLFTFRSPVPMNSGALDDRAADTAARWLLAYESCFRNLGDVRAKPE